ncbi:MAG: gliding motility-associated protein GldE [Bacteroidaceae bacterium]|nr:gliding motility-associated protein GldE [Bacteroidaceae bacterium]MBR5847314.1 gliding motility-associated protein GldE [Bacteroidaceae bacterium]
MLFCSGFVSASEIAFFSLTPSDLNAIEEGDSVSDRIISRLLGKSQKLLATILISNNFVNITITVLGNYAMLYMLDFGGVVWLEFLFITVLLTFLLLLFGEIMPKFYSSINPLKFCRFCAPVVNVLTHVLTPLSSLLVSSTRLVNRLHKSQSHNLSVDELEQALELTDKTELTDEQELLEGIIRFGDETAKDVMTSRLDMVTINIRDNYRQVLNCVAENIYSRIPVYSDTVDNIKGILYIKDLLPHLAKGDNFRWQTLMRPAFFVPETKQIDDLLRDFQASKVHIAIVVDEFGGTLGLVTLEDVIEEIVGEINDEYDEVERAYVKLNSNTYLFEAKTLLSDFQRELDLDDELFEEVEGDADSLAGLLLELKGDFPELHESIDFHHLTFEVMEMDERRIVKIKVVVHQNTSTSPADA